MATEQRLPTALRNQVAAAELIQSQLEAAEVAARTAPAQDPFAAALAAPPAPAPAPAPAAPAPAPAAPAPAPAPVAPAQTAPAALTQAELDSILAANRQLTEFVTTQQRPAPAPQPAPAPPPAPLTPQPVSTEHTDEQKRVFGEDVLNMVDSKIDRKLAPLYEAFRRFEREFGTVTGQVQQTQQVQAQTREQQLMLYLDTQVPTWRAVNTEPAWIAWLKEADPVYGVAKQAALDSAVAAADGARIAAIFKAYISTKAPAPAPAQSQNALESMVTPATVATESAAPAAPATAAPIFTSAQVQSFHNDLAKGRYRGREAEAQKIVEAIDLAAAAGRITR